MVPRPQKPRIEMAVQILQFIHVVIDDQDFARVMASLWLWPCEVRHMEVVFLWARDALRRKLFENPQGCGREESRQHVAEGDEHDRDGGENGSHRTLRADRDIANSG